MRTKALCTSCEEYVYTDADHSCRDAKALRTVRDAEAAVVEAAEEYVSGAMEDYVGNMIRYDAMFEAVRALHAARQGVGA
jgi:hypothetical protein